ncbi:amino acid aminotransferase [Marinibactrum halimedae]|uniref:Aromatic amino acid aminotransferase n=1 Tax=Marinibactrum halimedae TaxID=1444977 RepID=A0AA37T743_9GAMM|nr:amino acid aminotransferase [Marinibactrum halimedae]MCD9459500.1 aspartate/tyrosine/aromatic aminotransferase [Marinibactrum halimedae]GLS28154.1 aromatic amino acid aminotransferase [Marinibactrum halimedae]
MLNTLATPRACPILSLFNEYLADARHQKLNLGVGVYQDETGLTPIMAAVKAAEARLLGNQTTKVYEGIFGNETFNQAIQTMMLGGLNADGRASTLQTPGGTGALNLMAYLIASARPNATIWLSDPSYVNHRPVFEMAGLTVKTYRYLDWESQCVDEDAVIDLASQLGAGDVFLLHGCAHNPSGADLSLAAWQALAELAPERGFLPLIDIAYHGLGDGLEPDIHGARLLVDAVEEALMSVSCSKNFGLYRERTGAAIVIAESERQAKRYREAMCEMARSAYSMPPAHGAAIVAEILGDGGLTSQWKSELLTMSNRLISLRHELAAALKEQTQTSRFDFLIRHKGMFSIMGLSEEAINTIKTQYGIYLLPSGRINIAGLTSHDIPRLVEAIIASGG